MPPPTWMTPAIEELRRGVLEVAGPQQHNARILEYHATTRLGARDDETPWCSSFVNWCLERAGYQGTRSAAAASWKTWGVPSDAVFGAVAVFSRVGGHHVGFVVAKYERTLLILGGNQANKVSVAPYLDLGLLECRWAPGV